MCIADNIFSIQYFCTIWGCLFCQVTRIPMGTNCTPLLPDLFLYSYESEFSGNLVESGHRKLAKSFNLCYKKIDDLIVFNNRKLREFVRDIFHGG